MTFSFFLVVFYENGLRRLLDGGCCCGLAWMGLFFVVASFSFVRRWGKPVPCLGYHRAHQRHHSAKLLPLYIIVLMSPPIITPSPTTKIFTIRLSVHLEGVVFLPLAEDTQQHDLERIGRHNSSRELHRFFFSHFTLATFIFAWLTVVFEVTVAMFI
ncbi:hypothetical protein LX32DRAFT_195843 [Colletotrichum zoysiae]|uniref:Uncharacterized protein n=1 Tax=Colletotrichum zoysiae TaxID=1216348 RepID=A0AAD9H5Z2_9PEZI|nr:hypothetical protein LX32DRAFT_195843 [Colletotrichum zoysiae]